MNAPPTLLPGRDHGFRLRYLVAFFAAAVFLRFGVEQANARPPWVEPVPVRSCAEASAYLARHAQSSAPLEPMVLHAHSIMQGDNGRELRCDGEPGGVPVESSYRTNLRGVVSGPTLSTFLLLPAGPSSYTIERACLGCGAVDTAPPMGSSVRWRLLGALLLGLTLALATVRRARRPEGARALWTLLPEAPSRWSGSAPEGIVALRLVGADGQSSLHVKGEGASFVQGRWEPGLREGCPQLKTPPSHGYRQAGGGLPVFVGPGFVNALAVRAGQSAVLLPGDVLVPSTRRKGPGRLTVAALLDDAGNELALGDGLLRYHVTAEGEPALFRQERARPGAALLACLSVAVVTGGALLQAAVSRAPWLLWWQAAAMWALALVALPAWPVRWRRVRLAPDAAVTEPMPPLDDKDLGTSALWKAVQAEARALAERAGYSVAGS